MFQLFNDGACIRIEQTGVNGEVKVLMLAKEQVRTIDIIKNTIIRIDIGEGPLKNIFINHQDVTLPVAADAEALRALINGMMNSEMHDLTLAKEVTQQSLLTQMQTIAGLLGAIKDKETDFSQFEPTMIDESNPYMIYRGWHKAYGFINEPEWAIERIKKNGDEIIREWVAGNKNQDYLWIDRLTYQYFPFGHGLPNE